MLAPIVYAGSKIRMADVIIEHLPKHVCYVEPFGGSAAVLLSKVPSEVEVYNDLNEDLVTLFRVMRDAILGPELKRMCELTLYSRAEWELARLKLKAGLWTSPLARAHAVFVCFNQSHGGTVGAYTRGGWASSKSNNRTRDFTNRLDAFDEIAARLRHVAIECRPYEEVIEKYDSPNTVFYLDPPYLGHTRNEARIYAAEAPSPEFHKQLIDRLLTLTGDAILSGYASPHYAALERAGWSTVKIELPSTLRADGEAVSRTEVLWISPGCALRQPSLPFLAEMPT